MPHINYARGETRTFVFRRECHDRKSMRLHGRRAGKFYLWKEYKDQFRFGPGWFRCHCCRPDKDEVPFRQVRRRQNAKLRDEWRSG